MEPIQQNLNKLLFGGAEVCGSVIWDSELGKLPDHEFLREKRA